MTGRLTVVPLDIDEANTYVTRHHRHAPPVRGARFALGAAAAGAIVGVALVGRPVSRRLQDGWTVEVLRVCTRGHRNANSFLYGRSWRAARALGYRRAVTYTLASEPGASLRAAGWRVVAEVPAATWDRPSRPRVDKHPLQQRLRWEARGCGPPQPGDAG